MDPLAGSPWSAAETVAGFVRSPPNGELIAFAARELARRGPGVIADVGCGAGRNALPLADLGWRVMGLDLSWPMLEAAAARARDQATPSGRVHFALASMDHLPLRDRSVDVVVAHGIWNLARTSAEFRRAAREAARVARPGAALFVFTFSRHTLAPDAEPVPGEPFVFTQFSGSPQCFLTADQLWAELGDAGFDPEPGVALKEYNLPQPGQLRSGGPVIYEMVLRARG